MCCPYRDNCRARRDELITLQSAWTVVTCWGLEAPSSARLARTAAIYDNVVVVREEGGRVRVTKIKGGELVYEGAVAAETCCKGADQQDELTLNKGRVTGAFDVQYLCSI